MAISEAQALDIFGKSRFLSADRVTGVWNDLIKERRDNHAAAPLPAVDNPEIRYSEETLKAAATDPAWSLIWDPGLSLKENRLILGNNPAQQPCYYPDNDWWFSPREVSWATKKDQPGYYLIRTEGLFPLDNAAKHWDSQEEEIRRMGEAYQRTPSMVTAAACVSCLLLNNRQLLQGYSAFGPEMDADYCFIVVGFDAAGLNIGHWIRNDWGGYWDYNLRVILTRKFDF